MFFFFHVNEDVIWVQRYIFVHLETYDDVLSTIYIYIIMENKLYDMILMNEKENKKKNIKKREEQHGPIFGSDAKKY